MYPHISTFLDVTPFISEAPFNQLLVALSMFGCKWRRMDRALLIEGAELPYIWPRRCPAHVDSLFFPNTVEARWL